MELTEEKRRRYTREKWRLYIPEEDTATKKTVLTGLSSAGYEATPASTPWKNQQRATLAITFEAAEFISENFPNPRFKRVLLHFTSTNDWNHWREESPIRNPLVEAYDHGRLFTKKKIAFLPQKRRSS